MYRCYIECTRQQAGVGFTKHEMVVLISDVEFASYVLRGGRKTEAVDEIRM